MKNIKAKNLSAVDLNLLIAFDAMMQERNVTNAAARIGLAQPSMSNALSRLRGLLDDELFVRSPGAMTPTDHAVLIAPYVTEALEAADRAINAGQVFDPSEAEDEIRLATTDAFDYIFIAQLVNLLADIAPGVRIRTQAFDRQTYEDLLDRNTVDLAIGVTSQLPKRFESQKLYAESFVCIARKGHPDIQRALDMKDFLSADHALFSQHGDGTGVVDGLLEKRGQSRQVVTSIANYTALPSLVASTDQIAVVAERLALRASEHLPLNVFPTPLEVPTFDMDMIWGQGANRDPLQKWFRGVVKDLV